MKSAINNLPPPPPPTFHQNLTAIIPHLKRYAIYLTRNTHDAEDLLQSTLSTACEKHRYFQPDTNLLNWCGTVMYHLQVNEIRRNRRKSNSQAEYALRGPDTQPPTQGLTILVKEISRAINKLPKDLRTILLHAAREDSGAEICAELQIPRGTRGSRMFRARKRLRKMIGETP
jgi:RNA polymerase sigma-70 factor, ECF subfamily